MTDYADQMMADLMEGIAFLGRRGSMNKIGWSVSWVLRDEYRLRDEVQPNVLVIQGIELADFRRGQGHFSAFVDRLCAAGSCAGLSFDWVAFENCCDSLIAILEHKGFAVPDRLYRRVGYRQTRQLLLPFDLPATTQSKPARRSAIKDT